MGSRSRTPASKCRESIAVSSTLALREDASLTDRVDDITPLLESDEVLDATKSDAANVKSKLRALWGCAAW